MSVTAQYAGVCGECEEPIIPGQQITSASLAGGYKHVTCPDPTPMGTLCPRCYCIHPGEC